MYRSANGSATSISTAIPGSPEAIQLMAQRAAREEDLFAGRTSSGTVIRYLYSIGRNGWRYLVGVVELVDGKEVERRWQPRINYRTVAYKRAWRAAHIEQCRRDEAQRKRRERRRRA